MTAKLSEKSIALKGYKFVFIMSGIIGVKMTAWLKGLFNKVADLEKF